MTSETKSYHEVPTTPDYPIFHRTWIIQAKWAHPLWHSYAVLLYDLTTPGQSEPVIYLDGATHEVMVFAMDPDHPAEPPLKFLRPANHGYQFIAASDEAAVERVVALLEEIDGRKLSPDTDFRYMWDDRFCDGATLHMRGLR